MKKATKSNKATTEVNATTKATGFSIEQNRTEQNRTKSD